VGFGSSGACGACAQHVAEHPLAGSGSAQPATSNRAVGHRLTVCPRKQADDRTRQLRDLKTKKSRTSVPITKETAAVLRNYLQNHWKENPDSLLFSNRLGRPCKRVNVVRWGLHPILAKLGLPRAGMHAFRHGLGTALANAGVSPAIVQRTLRHTDIKTTLRFYVHADERTQREALAQIQPLQL
jgi:integrase